jgi:hypothetical protein
MATRLYLAHTDVPAVSPTFDASWESSASAVRRAADEAKAALLSTGTFVNAAVATALNSPAGAVDIALAQFTTAPLSGSQTISGAIKGQLRALESNAAADLRAQVVIWVRTSAGAVRGTLLASDAGALANEWGTATTNRKFPRGSPATPTSVAAQDGDRIVIELGYRKHENAVTSRTGTIVYGGDAVTSNLPEDESTTTQLVPWIEFADNLVFQVTPTRVTQVAVETLVASTTSDVRVTQVAVEVLVRMRRKKFRSSLTS